MAIEDLEYVERVTGVSLDEDKPLSDIKRKQQKDTRPKDHNGEQSPMPAVPTAGASLPKKPEYDWFDFFLKCGVSPYQCERYSSNFNRDSMDETVLPDVTPAVMRTLGLKEGDILKVMKYLDNKFGRTGAKSKLRNVSFGGEEVMGNEEDGDEAIASPGGGLFSGPGGTLKNNTRKGRPAPAVQTNDVVDPEAFKQRSASNDFRPVPIDKKSASLVSTLATTNKNARAFDDDAWDVKPSKEKAVVTPLAATSTAGPASLAPAPPTVSSAASQPVLTGAMADLSLLTKPLQPIIAHSTGAPQQSQNTGFFQAQQQPAPQQLQQMSQQPLQIHPQQPMQQQPTGASPSFFASLGPRTDNNQQQQNYGIPGSGPVQSFLPQSTGVGQSQTYSSQPQPVNSLDPQSSGNAQPQFQLNVAPRQRPQAPQFNQQGSLMPPPPPRPLSAPQNVSPQNNFGPPPLQPQLTGIPSQGAYQNQNTSPGQSLNELNKMRIQQQFMQQQQQIQPQFTGFGQQGQFNQYGNGVSQQPGMYGQQQPQILSQMTGYQPPPYLNGQQTGSPFADPRSPPPGSMQPLSTNMTGVVPSMYNTQIPQQTGSVNSMLPPALQPQPTGMNGFGTSGFGQIQSQPPMPPMPQQHTVAPLQPQKTGPAPPVRFGVLPEAKKLMPQATGRRANLSHASEFVTNESSSCLYTDLLNSTTKSFWF